MNRRADILEAVERVPALPGAALEALRLAREPSPELTALVTAIERDSGLTANLLRLANSAFFGYPRAVDSVRAATIRLGSQTVCRLAVAAAVATRLQGPVKGYDLPAGRLWAHALTVALGAANLGRRTGLTDTDAVFCAGLLADVGKLVLGHFVAQDAGPLLALAHAEQIPFDEAERRWLGLDHAEVGATLLTRWQLPEALTAVVRWHHQPERAGAYRKAALLVHTADVLAMLLGSGWGLDGLHYRLSPAVETELGLTDETAEELLDELARHGELLAPPGG